MISSLSLIDRDNDYIIIQDSNSLPIRIESKNFKFYKIKYPALSFRTLLCLHKFLEKEKIDIYHSPFSLTPLFAKIPTVVTLHDLMALKFPKFFQGRMFWIRFFARSFLKISVPLALKKSKYLFTDSYKVKSDVIILMQLHPKKINVIYPGIESHFKKMSDNETKIKVREKFGLPNSIILYLGNTRPYKNLPRLINAFKIVKKNDFKNYKLVIAGGEKRNLSFLKQIVKRLDIERDIIFIGDLTDEEVVALMNVADIFVFPSLEEGFGLPPLEAMACGTPVVTSNLSSLPEVVGDAAMLVDPKNIKEIASAIKQVLTDRKLREKLIDKGLERVKRFSWERTARETLKIYQQAYRD